MPWRGLSLSLRFEPGGSLGGHGENSLCRHHHAIVGGKPPGREPRGSHAEERGDLRLLKSKGDQRLRSQEE